MSTKNGRNGNIAKNLHATIRIVVLRLLCSGHVSPVTGASHLHSSLTNSSKPFFALRLQGQLSYNTIGFMLNLGNTPGHLLLLVVSSLTEHSWKNNRERTAKEEERWARAEYMQRSKRAPRFSEDVTCISNARIFLTRMSHHRR